VPPRIASSRCFATNCGYRYLGDWTDRAGNSNIDEGLLTSYLSGAGYTAAQISRALDVLHRHGRTLYGNNQAVYSLLRYGVPGQDRGGPESPRRCT
jgi:type I restriction enzyme R subunit